MPSRNSALPKPTLPAWTIFWATWTTGPVRSGGKRSEEHTPELQSLMRISYAVFCLKKKNALTTRLHLLPFILKNERAHYGTTVTNAHLECQIMLEKIKNSNTMTDE